MGKITIFSSLRLFSMWSILLLAGTVQAEVQEIVSKDDFNNLLNSANKPVLLEIYGNHCGHCIQFKATYEQLAEQYGDKVIFARAESNSPAASGWGIQSVPTFLGFKKNSMQPTIRQSGANKQVVENKIKNLINS